MATFKLKAEEVLQGIEGYALPLLINFDPKTYTDRLQFESLHLAPSPRLRKIRHENGG